MGLEALRELAASAFGQRYGKGRPRFFQAPGRVNLIGEHTDYNDGFVLPVAIDRQVVIAARVRDDQRVRLWSVSFEQSSEFGLEEIEADAAAPWSNYVRGVALMLQQQGFALLGIDATLAGNVPIGSGLASSAALEVASATALCALSNVSVGAVTLAQICQRAENEFVGMNCGIMDQFIAVLGQVGSALLIDCRSLDYQLVPVPTGASIVVCDTMKRRGLVESEYNLRRKQCEAGVEILREKVLNARALRDVTLQQLEAHADALPPTVLRRCRHAVSEDQRVLMAVEALRDTDAAEVGRLMDLSHASLRDDCEVSCRELDEMVRLARDAPGCLGARMTGAGFGGCTVNLVWEGQAEAFASRVRAGYFDALGVVPEIYVCQASRGAGEIDMG